MPYPPDKGEKIRAWNILRHLARDARVHLGCVVTTDADMAHLRTMREVCATVGAFRIDPISQRLRAVLHLRPGKPLMPDCYTSGALRRWVDATVAATDPGLIYVYTVAMAPHVLHLRRKMLLDAVDIDSEKWTEYATRARGPMRHVWRREGRTLLAYEQRVAAACDRTLFVSAHEADRFKTLSPWLASRIDYVENGVDLERFSPEQPTDNPFGVPGPHLVFTGHMDYWPNIDAVVWFAQEILPLIRRTHAAQFWIVGANPAAAVLALQAISGVHVTGRVADTRPYIAHADACVCPLRIARGIQNKVLEAMAMGSKVVASASAFEGIRAVAGQDLLVADGAEAFSRSVTTILRGERVRLGGKAREAMVRSCGWSATLQRLDEILQDQDKTGGAVPAPQTPVIYLSEAP